MKCVFTIAPGTSFLDSLAQGLWARAERDVFRLSEGLIFLPTRRACRQMREAFLRAAAGKSLLLPRMRPLGDIDEEELYFADGAAMPDIPAAVTPMRRHMLLTELVQRKDSNLSFDQASQLAAALARFLDETQIRHCDLGRLESLVQEQDLAVHWQETVKFLDIVTKAWPRMLEDEGGLIDPVERSNRIVAAQIETWRRAPPDYPVIAAGSTGSIPSTADLIDTIASLPQGMAVLPGLDLGLDEEAWQHVGPTHPQHAMKDLIERMGVERKEVQLWHSRHAREGGHPISFNENKWDPRLRGGDGLHLNINPRVRLLSESMRPAEVTEAWRDLKPDDIPREALHGLTRLETEHPQEEAQVIALRLREVLETPGKTALLVTADRDLAERTAALLRRWGVTLNDSAGVSLAVQPVGSFLLDILAAAAPEAEAIDFLSLLKHPYAGCGLSLAECRAHARRMEIELRRQENGARHPSFTEVKKQLQSLTDVWTKPRPLWAWVKTHIDVAERLAETAEDQGSARLWFGEAGEAAACWLEEWEEAARDLPPLNGYDYTALFGDLVRGKVVRPMRGQHPRLSILGQLEARLLQADVIILGGLNEGNWPPDVAADPWMSRPMRQNFGLPLPDYRTGLAAHDFVQLAAAPEVIITRARRKGTEPTVPSRFLLQLDTVLRALGYADGHDPLLPDAPWRDWAAALDRPVAVVSCGAPSPCPPVAARPTSLSVTEIGTWLRNPYAIYAKHVLKLVKLGELDNDIDAREKGNVIHQTLDEFLRAYPDQLPPDALDKLLEAGAKQFARYETHAKVGALWWPRFLRIAAWFIATERERRALGIRLLQAEASGRIVLDGFTLRGRADRIDRLPNGVAAITDYKTGAAPTSKQVESGLEPQLPLLALIAAEGGFAGLGKVAVSELSYWALSGGRQESEIEIIKGDAAELMEKSRVGLKALIDAFARADMPYEAIPKPWLQPRFDDYAHLARLAEWGRVNENN